jgi:hypothetical protein
LGNKGGLTELMAFGTRIIAVFRGSAGEMKDWLLQQT